MFIVESYFIGDFKLGDNINYNLRILSSLYEYYDDIENQKRELLLKPIIIILVSIVEAILYDFFSRIYNFTCEGVLNIDGITSKEIRSKKIDELEKYIACTKKHNFFGMKNLKFYKILDDLRKLRNRIHIQNLKQHFEKDDFNVFTNERKQLAENVLEKILKRMIEKYPRDKRFQCVDPFVLPWNEHFK